MQHRRVSALPGGENAHAVIRGLRGRRLCARPELALLEPRFRRHVEENHMNQVGAAAAVPTGKPAGSAKPTARERLVGTWTLVSLTVGEGTNAAMPYGANPRGMMMLDA